MVVTVWSPVDEFQALAMRLAAKVLLPGTGKTLGQVLAEFCQDFGRLQADIWQALDRLLVVLKEF